MRKETFRKKTHFIIAMVTMFLLFAGSLALIGCSDDGDLQGSIFDSNIESVKQGSPDLIPDITYEEAYENFFANPQWRGFTADTGEEVVEFTGECTYYEEEATVYIQFVIDDDTFSLYYAHVNVNGSTIELDEQTFVELVYTPFQTYSEEVLGRPLDDDVEEAFLEIYNSYY